MEIGLVGAGRMGTPMASNLARAGRPVIVHSRSLSAADAAELTAAGARIAERPEELAGAAVSISMLPDAANTVAVLERLLPATADDHVHVAMGTLGVAGAARCRAVVEDAGRRFADAPVSGSVALARTAAITAMVGADDAVFALVRPVLADMTRAQTLVGGPGAGSALKVAVNVVVAATNHALAEALVLAEAHGVDPSTAYDVLEDSAVASPYVRYKRDAFLHPGATPPSATVTQIDKDVRLALEAGADSGLHQPGATTLAQTLRTATGLGYGAHDMAGILDALRVLSGRPPATGPDHPTDGGTT